MATIARYDTGKGVRYRVRYRTPDGRQTDKRGFTRKKDAETFAATVEVSKLRGEFIRDSDGRITLTEVHTDWVRHRTRTKATTNAKNTNAWTIRVRDRWGDRQVARITTPEIRSWVADMVTAGDGPASISDALSLLRMVLDLAVENRQIATNPATAVKPPRPGLSDRNYLTHRQVEDLAVEATHVVRARVGRGGKGRLEETEDSIRGTVVRFLAYTGLRWGEMAALRRQDFDMLRRRATVARAVAEVGGQLVWSTPKDHERRTVTFPAFLTVALAELVEGLGPDGLVFASSTGEPLRVSWYRPRVMVPAVKRLQAADEHFPKVTPHDLRHTAASLAISAGANVKAVQLMLGHASAAMTLDTYSDLFPDDLEAVAGRLDHARSLVVSADCGQIVGTNAERPGIR